ncbi:MAG: DUF4331 domain-containing protein [Promicromonosporaceae bacterium]|nr:DUF4331 domain-containing protein [Promicromonosporaceae bacterium]
MSHHLDSPASRQDPRLNLTDLYVFDRDGATVLVLVTNTSLAAALGLERTPGFHPEGRYEAKVHLDGSAAEQVTYRVTFDPADALGDQRYVVDRLAGADAADDLATGTRVAEGTTGRTVRGDGVTVWAGAAADPFYLDLHHLDHILEGLQHGTPIDDGDWTTEKAESSFTGSQVEVVVLAVPTTDPELRDGRQVGVWGTTKLATDAGGWRQINRAAIPMVWPLFRAIGGDDASPEYGRDTLAHPSEDRANDAGRVASFVAAAVAPTGVADPDAYGRQVAARLLPDVLPYTVGTPAAFTFAGFNGRALSDNAPEVVYGLVTNAAVPTGLVAADAAETRQPQFPYVVPANS